MKDGIHLQVEFYSKDEAAIHIESRTSANELLFSEVLLFCSFALRQLHNLGRKHPVTHSLATVLASTQDARTPLTLFVGPPDFSFRHSIFSLKDEPPDPLKNHVSVDEIKLVPFKERLGEKRFVAALGFRSKRALLRVHPKGFGRLGRGLNYYAPLSVGLLLRHLAFLDSRGPDYVRALALAARLCGEGFLVGKVTVASQPVLAFEIAECALHPTQ